MRDLIVFAARDQVVQLLLGVIFPVASGHCFCHSSFATIAGNAGSAVIRRPSGLLLVVTHMATSAEEFADDF